MLRKLKSFDLHSKRILIRVDFNVPILDDVVVDDYRIRKTIPTIKHCIDQGAKVILMSHLGRPKGVVSDELSLEPISWVLEDIIEQEVQFADDCMSKETALMVDRVKPREIVLLENLRFYNEKS